MSLSDISIQPGQVSFQNPTLETNAFANERGGLEPVIRNAVTFSTTNSANSNSASDYPGVDVHAFKFEAGTHEMDFDKGRFFDPWNY